jgi:hypothetical protein
MQTSIPSLDAYYYDGINSRRQRVRLSVGDGCLLLDGPDGGRSIPATAVRVSEAQGSAPRTLRFADDASFCEAGQGPEFDALLAAIGHRDGIAVCLQNRPSVAANLGKAEGRPLYEYVRGIGLFLQIPFRAKT